MVSPSLDMPMTASGSSGSTDLGPRYPVHIEVRLSPTTTARFDTIRQKVFDFMSTDTHLYLPSLITGWESEQSLNSSVEQILATESSYHSNVVPMGLAILDIHVYQPGDLETEEFSAGGDNDDVLAASGCDLPCRAWEGLWDSLVYPDDIKSRLLNYIYATLLFSDAGVDLNIISWNRVVLLHGPPGTGKTSLCRALAQKLAIRLSYRYAHTKLLEINSHSLFSRWFSESGKLVQRLFSSITDLVEDEENFVVVLIDEVESLTAARAGALAGTEPSDALRVVNALLTQLDKLRHRKNVLVMATSNLAKAIDSAFVDRADIVQYIDLPPREAIYEILRSCVVELMNKGIISLVDLPENRQAEAYARSLSLDDADDDRPEREQTAIRLFHLADRCKGLSGRMLRRLPVLAQAKSIGIVSTNLHIPMSKLSMNGRNSHSRSSHSPATRQTDISQWLAAMEQVVANEAGERLKTRAL